MAIVSGVLPAAAIAGSVGKTGTSGRSRLKRSEASISVSAGVESNEALVARAGRGDRVAAGELVVRHSDRIMAVCYRMLNDRSAAEDATQETFLRLWKSAGSWRPKGAKFETWLYRVAMNHCLDRLRRKTWETSDDAAPDHEDDAPRADELIAFVERKATIDDAIAALPERQRQAIVLCHFQELSNIETAEIMETSVEAVESLLGRARRTLRKSLSPMRDELMEGIVG